MGDDQTFVHLLVTYSVQDGFGYLIKNQKNKKYDELQLHAFM